VNFREVVLLNRVSMYRLKAAKILRVIFVLALVVLCILLAWSLVLYVLGLGFQWWVKATILTCLAASVITALLLRKLWLKRREMKFVDGIVGTGDMPGSVAANGEAARELRRRFKEAMATLKKSDLKRKGNPLYVLPWYLMVGRSGAGKSTAVKSARLPSPFGDINRVSGIEGTRNCDWWFFDESVVIDIAGRYAVHRHEAYDRNEWLAFLEHLVSYRKKEPINGVIVTVEADRLLQADVEALEDEGRILRQRIDEVINVMGARFPTYLLVTKCDLIFGMHRFYQMMAASSLDQAMGFLNHDGQTDISVFVNQTLDILVDKLKDIRLILANEDQVRARHSIEPEVLLFPDEFSRMRRGLVSFCKGAFKDNPFQELPLVRGVYFCSGQQVGRPVSTCSGSPGQSRGKELPGTGNGFFLHDFFAKILPADRAMYAPTRRATEWHRLTQNLWLTGFVTIVLVFCILLTHSWNENKAAINKVSPQYKKTILFKNDPLSDIAMMDDFGREIKSLETVNKKWKAPRLGLFASVTLERNLKKRYCKRFFEHFETDIHTRIGSRVAEDGWQQNDHAPAVRYIPFITRHVNLIRARIEGADERKLHALPSPDYSVILADADPRAEMPEIAGGYTNAFINYLVWQQDVEGLNRTLADMQALLRNYFIDNHGDLRWLAQWAGSRLRDKTVTLNQFWKSRTPDDGTVSVDPAFTRQGRDLIGRYVTGELEKAVEQPMWIAKAKNQFVGWYKNAYFGRWMTYCRNFDQGMALFKTEEDYAEIIERLTGTASPYDKLFDTLDEELAPEGDNQWPSLELDAEADKHFLEWLADIKKFSVIRKAVASDAVTDNKAVEKLADRVSFRGKTTARLALGAMAETELARAKEAFKRYRSALGGFSGTAASTSRAYEIARQGFEDDPAQAESAVWATQKSIESLRHLLGRSFSRETGAAKKPFWGLLTQPLDLLWKYTVDRAGCHLQRRWDEQVLAEIQGVNDRQRLVALLFGDKGLVDRFNQKQARPFIKLSSRRGYHARTLRECRIPFRRSYFGFLVSGKKWARESGGQVRSNYPVDVVALPTDVNNEAKIKPHMTQLVVQSDQGDMELVNRQYPIEAKFNWAPAACGDVLLQIMLGDIALTKRYTGYCAFGKFLRDFRGGRKVFTVRDFPEYAPAFHRMAVREIEVVYRFQPSQVEPILRLLKSAPGRPPTTIIACSG
jgi:type VI secretion system protein ImpL